MNENCCYILHAILRLVLEKEDIDAIMEIALESGISYWCYKAEVVGKYLGIFSSDQISRNGILKLYDANTDDIYELTLDKFLTGLRLWLENEQDFSIIDGHKLATEDMDANDADAIIQYALFNDIIYG